MLTDAVAYKYPGALVTGKDLRQVQPSHVLPNVKFEVNDVEQAWTYNTFFDFVHARNICGFIKDWPALLENAYKCVYLFLASNALLFCLFIYWSSRLDLGTC